MVQLYLAIFSLIDFLTFKSNFLKSIGIKLLYNNIYFYSACQIKCNKVYNYLLPYLKNHAIIDQIIMEQFNFDTNKLTNIVENDLQKAVNNTLYIASKVENINKNNSSIINKLIINKKYLCFAFDAFDAFDVSNIRFISLYLNYNGDRFNINLKTDEINYYLVGNKIDKYFVQYYINTVLCLNFSYAEPEITTYELELIDHEVNVVYLTSEQSIIIDKDEYHIINNK